MNRIARILYLAKVLTADFQDISALKRYLKNKSFHIYDFKYEFEQYHDFNSLLEQANIDQEEWGKAAENEDYDKIEELSTQVTKSMSEDDINEFVEYLMSEYSHEAPSWGFMDFKSYILPSNTWLVHFSDNAYNIKQNGFTYGMDQMDKLGLTTYFSDNTKKYGGYNFAFDADSRDASAAANQGKYGKDAVLFKAPGIKTYHHSDQEYQIIFYGKDVSPKNIILLEKQDGDWVVIGGKRGELFRSESFNDTVSWVQKNYRQYNKPLSASKKIKTANTHIFDIIDEIKTKRNSFYKKFNLAPDEKPINVAIKIPQSNNRFTIIHPSTRHHGKWQLTYFDQKGPIGDQTHNSLDSAIKEVSINNLNKAEVNRIKKASSEKEMFYKKHNIDEDIHWLGKGDFGDVYDIGNNKVLKITRSKKEYDIAKQLINKNLSGFVDYYVAEKVGNEYMIIMELLETPTSIEDKFSELQLILDEQQVPISYIDQYFDTDELELDKDMLDFISDIEDVARSYRSIGIEASDIRSENLGYNKNGKLKAFDIFDRSN